MNEIKAKCKIELTRYAHYIKDKLGLPVNYTDAEFSSFKKSLDWSSLPHDRTRILSTIFNNQDHDIQQYISEAEEIVIEEKTRSNPDAFKGVGNPMGRTDRITLYAAIRAYRPEVVVETGTAAGASATYILEALMKNGRGCLYSVDIERKGQLIGRLIPDFLRSLVRIRSGDSLAVLPELLKEAGSIDFFLHDSLHTYVHMMAEYEMVYPHMKQGGVICSHDVLLTNAWKHFIKRYRLCNWGIVKNLGICLVEKGASYGT
jgi:predicted O-methyltransferase YrrM